MNVKKCLDAGTNVDQKTRFWTAAIKNVKDGSLFQREGFATRSTSTSTLVCQLAATVLRKKIDLNLKARNLQENYDLFRNAVNRDLCIDINGGKSHNGNFVHLWPCRDSIDGQMWFMDSAGYIRSRIRGNICLEAGTNVDQQLKIRECAGQLHQRWELTAEGKIRS